MVNVFSFSRLFLSLSVMAVAAAGFSSQALAQRISEVRVEGAQRIEAATILSYSGLEVGGRFDRSTFDRTLKTLFATGLFADVALELKGNNAVVIQVVENPLINQIAFEGNRRIEDQELLSEIQMRPRQVFTKSKVQDDVARLYQVYRRNGRFSVSIEPKVIKLDQNRVDLVFELSEGEITKVGSIRFVGNKRFDDSALRAEITTKETAWYRFISGDDKYDPDRLSYDEELLRRFYTSNGYADFNLISSVAELSNDQSRFFVTFTVEEGERYRLGDVTVDSQLRNFDTSILEKDIALNEGDWYSSQRVQETVAKLTDILGDHQYAFVNIRPMVNKRRGDQVIDLNFAIEESARIFVERININGNVRTLDRVIRREILLAEGDPYNKTKLKRSEQNMRNLNYFENLNMQVKQGSAPDKTVVDVDVVEKSTGELSLGAGFSTTDGVLGDFSIRERNLLGKGQDLSLGMILSGERTEFNLGFTEPFFLNRDMSAGFDAFHSTRDYQDESSYDQTRSGGGLRFGYPLSDRWRQLIRYRAERNEITDVTSASRFILEQEGERDTSAVSLRTTYDSRNSTVFPTDGWLLWLDTEVAGLGGDAKYVSGKTGFSYFYPIMDQWTLNVLAEGGMIEGYDDTEVAINERFFLGGNNLRGFEQAGVGPRDISTDDSLGGNTFYRATVETSFPIGLPNDLGVKGHLFTDVGSLFNIDDTGSDIEDKDTMRASAGFGLSWRSPFGPLRADFAFPYMEEEFDEDRVFNFNFGTRF